jgi:predicted component of type VI protein secretion system
VGMGGYLEWWDGQERRVFPLESDRVTVGSSLTNDVVIDEPSVSRVHAILQLVSNTWMVEDCGSRNGTFVQGKRIPSLHPLRPEEELRLGRVQVRLGGHPSAGGKETEAATARPALTMRERDVLVALCAPLADGDVFTEPSSVREIAAALQVSDAAVKQHLTNLYDKLGVVEGDRRRSRLANAALDSAAVTVADIRAFRA